MKVIMMMKHVYVYTILQYKQIFIMIGSNAAPLYSSEKNTANLSQERSALEALYITNPRRELNPFNSIRAR